MTQDAKDKRIAELEAEVAKLKKASEEREALVKVDKLKDEINARFELLTSLADRYGFKVYFDGPFTRARGAGGMTYYGKGTDGRHDEESWLCTPDDYGGWRSSATDDC